MRLSKRRPGIGTALGWLQLLVVLVSLASILPVSGAVPPAAGDVSVMAPVRDGGLTSIPPYIDAMDGIQPRGVQFGTDPALWPRSATIEVRGSKSGIDVATVRLRIEGKGDPVNQSVPQQTMFTQDNSGSMVGNDPNNLRCDAEKYYADLLTLPSELGLFAFYGLEPPWGTGGDLLSPLSTDYMAVKNAVSCNGNGGTPIEHGLKMSLDEIIPKKKTGFAWVIILLTDGIGGDPQLQVDRATNASVKIFAVCLNIRSVNDCDPKMPSWATPTGGKFYWLADAKDLNKIYKEIYNSISSDVAGRPPKTGAPMITFKLTDDLEVVPGSFQCKSSLCSAPQPTNAGTILPNNKGLKLEWAKPVNELRIGQTWEVEFGVRSYRPGTLINVNDVSQSFIEYDRYDGSPGGSDVFEQLHVNVAGDLPGAGGAGIAEPPQPPPPPPHGGIPQLIPNPQQVPITYIQNLPVLHGVTQVQGIPLQYLLGSVMGLAIADRIKMKSRIKQGVKIAMASM